MWDNLVAIGVIVVLLGVPFLLDQLNDKLENRKKGKLPNCSTQSGCSDCGNNRTRPTEK